MYRLFKPLTNKEIELVSIIKTHRKKPIRAKALKELRKLLGCENLYTIVSKEYYSHIQDRPKYYQRFRSASIEYDDVKLKR